MNCWALLSTSTRSSILLWALPRASQAAAASRGLQTPCTYLPLLLCATYKGKSDLLFIPGMAPTHPQLPTSASPQGPAFAFILEYLHVVVIDEAMIMSFVISNVSLVCFEKEKGINILIFYLGDFWASSLWLFNV